MTGPKQSSSRCLPLLTAFVIAGLPIAATLQSPGDSTPLMESDKVYLEHADRLVKNNGTVDDNGEYQVLIGNVRIRKGGMLMTCDSAHFYETSNSFEAFGNVKMEQGDTLFVYGDQLYYDGPEELATLFGELGKKVRLINRDVTLRTYVFYYDLRQEVGYYDNWGELTDRQNKLTSIEGEYHPNTKDAWFYQNVNLESPRVQNGDTTFVTTDSLNYNTATGVAEILTNSVIRNTDGIIYTSFGTYDTNTDIANLYRRSQVETMRGNTLIGDTLFFDRNSGIGEAFGNVVIVDSARQTSILGNYGYYNDPTDSAFVTGRALAKEYSRGDTLYLHGDTIEAYVEVVGTDSVHLTNVYHRVRFYRSDLQGMCDSVSAADSDSILRMFRSPVIWSGDRQVAGDVIFVHSNDSVPDWAHLPAGGVMSEHIGEDCFNQLSGNDMMVWFNDSTIERLLVSGNVTMVLFPQESDSTYNKYVYLESSTMDAYFKGRSPEKINYWPETTYDIVPLYLAKRRDYLLPNFRNYSELRPMNPMSVFEWPDDVEDLFQNKPVSEKWLRKPIAIVPKPLPQEEEENIEAGEVESEADTPVQSDGDENTQQE